MHNPLETFRDADHAATLAAGGILSPGMLTAAGVLLITVCMMSLLRRKMKSRVGVDPHLHARERLDNARADREARRSIEDTVVEAEELTRRLVAHLDTKSARLEELIRQADDRIARLTASAAPDASRDHDAAARPAAEPRPNARRSAPQPASRTQRQSRLADPVSVDVYRLADEGLPPIEIAQRLSEGVGKVELILALREN